MVFSVGRDIGLVCQSKYLLCRANNEVRLDQAYMLKETSLELISYSALLSTVPLQDWVAQFAKKQDKIANEMR